LAEREKMTVLRLRLICLALFVAFIDGECRDNKRDLNDEQAKIQNNGENERADN
jgi:hypothetical protein